ncbi:hypothetical protein UA32_12335 [Photobacterium angustum]|nr:hypothetical protein UA32_12335 [Photobacterium angustum]
MARPISAQEPDLLAGNEFGILSIIDSYGKQISTIEPPENGWTHNKLEALLNTYPCRDNAYDAYLSSQWIGSTEV